MRTDTARLRFLSVLTFGCTVLGANTARAVNPLEYPDNGAAQFSRGGAWLALANEPIAAHYNPAALAIQGSGLSIEQQLNFNHVCYERVGPNGTPEGPNGYNVPAAQGLEYLPVCNSRASFPMAIPSVSAAFR